MLSALTSHFQSSTLGALSRQFSTQMPLSRSEILKCIGDKPISEDKALFERANDVTKSVYGNKVFLRGIIEFSNHCAKNCNYCGIRRDHPDPERYEMSQDDILETIKWAHEKRYAGILLQSGEVGTQDRVDFVADTLKKARKLTGDKVRYILSLGELTDDQYYQLLQAGADRYLLRMETSNPALYAKLHPQDGHHDWLKRLNCVKSLVGMGYQVATGVMTGLPGQTKDDLADDIEMFNELGIDMIGLGPYIPQVKTPTADAWMAERGRDSIELTADDKAKMLLDTIRMLATIRLCNPDVNIAATTALQALKDDGREWALESGANVVMPILTPKTFRAEYQLYQNKPCIDDSASECMGCMDRRVRSIGKTLCFGELGDPKHFTDRIKKV
ncbi:Iron hydrogenase maturase HydE [Carpediemonas membranifera]|uniref:Iron hydrogenase maturase HydE n=1 Tax=Carpediemonas membranifera TaxID=201153 RepID=A0A8J6E1A6_9EUKA|nr:Iron hydrogenase maturase HydE [Carpediemonas membranifera]|eukprot:KAG9393233.1 Iron hydrogenase maturase HydE [Carpediemonas membranifera]